MEHSGDDLLNVPSSVARLMVPQVVDVSMASAPQEEDHYSMGSGSNAMEDIWDVEDDDAGDTDQRIVFLYMYLNRSFKIKSDRWAKVVQSEDTRKIIFGFFDKPEVDKLIFTLPTAGYLLPSNEFPWNPKGKCAYFIKKEPVKITAENIFEVLRFGDFSPQPIEELIVMLEEISHAKDA